MSRLPPLLAPAVLVGTLAVSGCASDEQPTKAASTPSATATPSPTPQEEPVQQQEPARPDPRATQRLSAAVAAGDVDGVRRAVAAGADLEVRDGDRRTPLLLATRAGQVAIARVLLDAGADPDLADGEGVTPLAHARSRGYDAIAELLVAADARE